MYNEQKKIKNIFKEIGIVFVGNLLLAIAMSFFLINYKGMYIYGVDGVIKNIPFNGILGGGTSGFSLILRKLFFENVNNNDMIIENIVTITTVVLFVIGSIFLGKKFAIQTILSTILCPIFLYLFKLDLFDYIHIQINQFDPVICALIGGALMGLGCGIIYKIGGSTGGFDVPGLIINKFTKVKLSLIFFIQDAILVVLALVADFTLYEIVIGLASVLAYSVVVEIAQRVGNEAYFCDIITDKWEEINREILALDRGTTIIDVTGGFTGKKRKMIKTMVGKKQYMTVIEIVKRNDPEAFMSMTLTHNVFGEGYRNIKEYSNK